LVELTREDLLGHLREQINFLERSSASYDAGFEDEAKRLAVVIRVLCHDSSKSTSLLSSLKMKTINFYDTALAYSPSNMMPYIGLVMMRISAQDGGAYVSPLDGGPPTRSQTRKIPFNVWWSGVFVLKDRNNQTFNRKDLVLNLADKEGGAHIDPNLNDEYANLAKFNSLGWKVFRNDISENFKNSPVLPCVRQIAHEVLKTLKDEFPT
jgi:hypothetical protein